MKYINIYDTEAYKSWMALCLRGILFFLFATSAVFWPNRTIDSLGFLFGFFVLLDGAASIWAGMISRQGAFIMFGVFALVIGSIAFFPPSNSSTGLFYLAIFGVWSLLRGFIELSIAIKIRQKIAKEWWLILSGVLCMTMGISSVYVPPYKVLDMLWALVAYAFIMGTLWIVICIKLHELAFSTRHNNSIHH